MKMTFSYFWDALFLKSIVFVFEQSQVLNENDILNFFQYGRYINNVPEIHDMNWTAAFGHVPRSDNITVTGKMLRHEPILSMFAMPFPLVCSVVAVVSSSRNNQIMVKACQIPMLFSFLFFFMQMTLTPCAFLQTKGCGSSRLLGLLCKAIQHVARSHPENAVAKQSAHCFCAWRPQYGSRSLPVHLPGMLPDGGGNGRSRGNRHIQADEEECKDPGDEKQCSLKDYFIANFPSAAKKKDPLLARKEAFPASPLPSKLFLFCCCLVGFSTDDVFENFFFFFLHLFLGSSILHWFFCGTKKSWQIEYVFLNP